MATGMATIPQPRAVGTTLFYLDLPWPYLFRDDLGRLGFISAGARVCIYLYNCG